MGKSYRIRTKVGADENISIQLDQDFEQIEILSLKIRQDDVYIRSCADYGVITGRIFCNGGYGLPNAKVSVFVPIQPEDENNPIISTIYPFKTIEDTNEDGYKFNLLPYLPSYAGHVPTGTFPSRLDALTDKTVVELYDKYYKYTVTTNQSGDYMIFGVPVGTQTLVMNVDLSDIGEFSLSPQDIIRLGIGNETQTDGFKFKASPNFSELPQIIVLNKTIDVQPFWGQDDVCQIGITRTDFDLTKEANINIQPTSIFMGSIFSSSDSNYLKSNCNIKNNQGNLCDLVTSPGEIIAIRQTIFQDTNGDPILEQHLLENGGKVIDENGAFMVELPMNLNYVTTNEFGEQVLSNDPTVGIPTKGKYRFKIKYQSDRNGQPIVNGVLRPIKGTILRANFLVPQVREYGWIDSNTDPSTKVLGQPNYEQFQKSYAFSLDWNDYADKNAAINCEDFFYEMSYNKVYTTAQLIDEYRSGSGRQRFIGIKEVLDTSCESENNRFPVNDGVKQFDFLTVVVTDFLLNLFTRLFISFIPLLHVIALLWPILKYVLTVLLPAFFGYLTYYFITAAVSAFPAVGLIVLNSIAAAAFLVFTALFIVKVSPLLVKSKFKGISLPMISYPECVNCPCDIDDLPDDEITDQINIGGNNQELKIGKYTVYSRNNGSFLADVNSNSTWASLIGDVGNTQPIGLDPDNYSGSQSKREEKYNADLFGFRYALAGYPIGNEMGVPITRRYSISNDNNNNQYYVSPDVTISQSLNLINLRSRYFTQENIIQTTVNSTVQPFTDNVVILLVDPTTSNQLISGSLLSFVNPNDQTITNDKNTTGGTINQFGTNTVTASCLTNKTITQNYIKPDGTVGVSVFNVTSSIEETEYLYKTGVEYFQVITGMTLDTANLYLAGGSSLIKDYIISKNQNITYFNPNSLTTVNINPLQIIANDYWKKLEIVILNRGVDPYTQKQNIKYDLSKLFGYTLGSNTITVEGEYFLNVPIQTNSGSGAWWTDYRTPEGHTEPYTTSAIFHTPFNFNVSTNFSSVTTTALSYYSSLDKSQSTFKPDGTALALSNFTTPDGVQDDFNNAIYFDSLTSKRQGIVEGGSLVAASNLVAISNISSLQARVYSPRYSTITRSIGGVNPKIVLRSDRLPTSDSLQNNGNNSFALNLNDNFVVYLINQLANSDVTKLGLTDTNDNLIQFTANTPTFAKSITTTFNCGGMVPLRCYQSYSNGITVKVPCPENENPVRVKNGCYQLVQKPYVRNIPKDILNVLEWNRRYRLMYALCRNVMSLTFVNNWINGSLYMFSFQKEDLYTENLNSTKFNSLPTYKFCNSNIVFQETNNAFFYRATPYISGSNQFFGKTPPQNAFNNDFPASNKKLLGNPTTIMDLGPKNNVIKQLTLANEYLGYVADTIPTTSYQDTSDVIQLYITSRLVSTSFIQKLMLLNNSSIDAIFSRKNDRIDGDLAQMLSINSEYGVYPYLGNNYSDQNISTYQSNLIYPVVGVFFSSDTSNRDYLSPGRETFIDTQSTFISRQYGFRDQKVPFYYWEIKDEPKIFGNQKNDWLVKENINGIGSVNYQSVDRLNSFSVDNPTYPSNTRKPSTEIPGYIYNSKIVGGKIQYDLTTPSGFQNKLMVGAPYHFYFGLKVGKTSMNKFIKTYVNNIDDL